MKLYGAYGIKRSFTETSAGDSPGNPAPARGSLPSPRRSVAPAEATISRQRSAILRTRQRDTNVIECDQPARPRG
eukprot:1188956-Prorocentrum_minimum.AAC.4